LPTLALEVGVVAAAAVDGMEATTAAAPIHALASRALRCCSTGQAAAGSDGPAGGCYGGDVGGRAAGVVWSQVTMAAGIFSKSVSQWRAGGGGDALDASRRPGQG
jgi:hypothetical protein